MAESDLKMDMHFFQLVISLQMAAMQQMGKIMSPISGEVERNLEQAKTSIDMLAMLAEKTKNNLEPEEDKFLNNILYELRMNYLEESKKPELPPAKGDEEASDSKASNLD